MEDAGLRWWHPRLWGAHLIGLLCVSAAVGMGLWQHDAWQERRAAEQVDLTEADPLPLGDVFGPDDPFPRDGLGRPVEVEGTWLDEGTVLVEGRTAADGADGLWVVTPLTDGAPDAPAVPVVRGWVPDGTELSAVPAPGEAAQVTGWLQPPEGTGQPDPDPTDDVLLEVRIADLVQRVDQDLYGGFVIADLIDPTPPNPADGEVALAPATLDQLPQVGTFTALRNILYAIEWWVFAAFAAFIWFRFVRDATRPTPESEGEDEPVADVGVASGS